MMTFIFSLFEKFGFSLVIISLLLVLTSIFGLIDFNTFWVMEGQPIRLDMGAAIYLIAHFIAENFARRSVIPQLHPSTMCSAPKCGSKKVTILSGKIQCHDCGNIYTFDSEKTQLKT